MGFGLGKSFKHFTKKVGKIVKSAASMPFEAARDVGRGARNLGQAVGRLSKGDFEGAFYNTLGAVGNVGKGAANVFSLGQVSEGGIIDTKVEEEQEEAVDEAMKPTETKAHVSFADAASPDIILGADEVEEDIRKRARKDAKGFLGGLSNQNGLLL